MDEPTVCAVMLTRDRHEMARRAVECFRAQTYDPISRLLLIYDTGDPSWYDARTDSENEHHWTPQGASGATIGALRNTANMSAGRCDIFLHWDDDDWSHPNRIAEQVALLQATGADCVGYREMLFWDERGVEWTRHPDGCKCGTCGTGQREVVHGPIPPRAWLYADAYRPVGTSLCYWRRTWERHPFPDLPQPRRQPNPDVRGEDVEWLRGVNFKAVELACGAYRAQAPEAGSWIRVERSEPRMIARIHSGNSSGSYAELGKSVWWRRVPAWDAYCRERMAP